MIANIICSFLLQIFFTSTILGSSVLLDKTMRLLDGRIAVITGSTRGNGRAMANLFSEHGANVVVTGREEKEAQSTAEQLGREYQTNTLGFKLDVSQTDEVNEMVSKADKKYGQIDILVNNAGYNCGTQALKKYKTKI